MAPTAVRIKRIKLSKRFTKQLQVSVPSFWLKEQKLSEGDFVDLLKDTEGRLLLIPVPAGKA